MNAESVEFVPREGSSVTLGTSSASDVMSPAPLACNSSPLKALIAIGTEVSDSLRRRAVTMISPSLASGAAVASALAVALTVYCCAWARPGSAPSATPAQRMAEIERTRGLAIAAAVTAMVLSLARRSCLPSLGEDNTER
jgi:hypothetical protein